MNTRRSSSLVVALVALASLGACAQGDTTVASDAPSAQESPSAEQSEDDAPTGADPVALTADSSVVGKCAVPSAETLSTFDTAFAGTVTGLDAGTATLSVEEWYAGGDGASTVTVASPSQDLQDLLLAVDFEQGKSYLVSADGDRVTLCGFTAEQTADLQALYDEAFTQ